MKLQKPLSPNQKVLNYICEGIKSKQFVEGYRLPTENELSEILGVGRNSVREALKISSYLGLTVSIQGSGHRVTSDYETAFLTVIQLLLELLDFNYKDISNVREALELKSLELIIANGVSKEDIIMLNQCIDNMENGVSPTEYDALFHKKLAELSDNTLIYHLNLALANIADSYILISWDKINEEEKKMLIENHKEILTCIENRIDYTYAISNHYKIADQIIQHELFSNVPLNENIIKNLKKFGLSDLQIKKIIE